MRRPLGDRATTTVATQALFLMNSGLVADASEHLAARLLAGQDVDDAGPTARDLLIRELGATVMEEGGTSD